MVPHALLNVSLLFIATTRSFEASIAYMKDVCYPQMIRYTSLQKKSIRDDNIYRKGWLLRAITL